MEWIIKLQGRISREMTANSMKSCALALAVDGSWDGLISYFEEGEKMQSRQSTIEKSNVALQ